MKAIPHLLIAVLLPAACTAVPEREPVAQSSTSELENAFWACDYVATMRGVQATPMGACRHATETLQREKFGGSFPAMLEWWRSNKVARHQEMQRRFD